MISKKMIEWYLEPEERRELVAAIYLYIYKTRKGAEEK